VDERQIAALDEKVRRRVDTDELLNYTDLLILQRGLGLSLAETTIIQGAYRKLRARRLRVN
jgi:hypothetical protein